MTTTTVFDQMRRALPACVLCGAHARDERALVALARATLRQLQRDHSTRRPHDLAALQRWLRRWQTHRHDDKRRNEQGSDE